MGTFYNLHSMFTLKQGVTRNELLKAIHSVEDSKSKGFRTISRLMEHGDSPVLIADEGARVVVTLGFENFCSYSTIEELDREWTELAKEFADLTRGPVECTSGGDDYDDGPREWLVGPEREVFKRRLARVEMELAVLERERAQLQKKIDRAGDCFVVHGN